MDKALKSRYVFYPSIKLIGRAGTIMRDHETLQTDTDSDRRRFLEKCGRFAATVPPTMTVLLSTSMTSKAIAMSSGGDGGSGPKDSGGPKLDAGRPKVDAGGPKDADGPKLDAVRPKVDAGGKPRH
jgi:hypothetical protein